MFRSFKSTSVFSKNFGSRRWVSSHSAKIPTKLPLFEPLPGVPALEKYDNNMTFQVTKLFSGPKIASISTKHPLVSVGVYLNSGSRNENEGFTFFLQHHGFQSTTTRSGLRVVREAEIMAANYSTSSGREYLNYCGQVFTENLPDLVHHLVDVTKPSFSEFEVNETKPFVEAALNAVYANSEEYILDVAHQQAFRNRGLGNSLYTHKYQLDQITSSSLLSYHNKTFKPQNFTVVAVGGVKHEEFSELVKQNFTEGKQTKNPTKAVESSHQTSSSSRYFGGEYRIPNGGDTHVVLGFEGVGYKSPKYVTAGVLQYLLGECVSTNTRPGTGVSSVLGNIMRSPKSPFHKLSSFNFNYSDSGFFGVSSIVDRSRSTDEALALLLSSLTSFFSSPISPAHLARAKAQYKLHLGSTSQSSLLNFAYQQTQSDSTLLPYQLFQPVDSVSAQEIQSLAKQILSSNPTLVVIGDVSYDPISKLL